MSRVIGIDLGTSNARVAVMDRVTPLVLPTREGARATPTVVAFTGSGETLVGQAALRQGLTHPESTVYGFAKFIGCRFDSPEVQLTRRTLPYVR